MTTHTTPLDTAPRRQSWSRGFAAASIAMVWAVAFWTYVLVQSAGSYHMRGFVMLPLGLGVVGSIFALQASDDLSWRLDPIKRGVLATAVVSFALLLWAPVVLGFALPLLGR